MTASSSLKGSGSTCATLHIHVGIDLLGNDNSILRHRGQSLNVPHVVGFKYSTLACEEN